MSDSKDESSSLDMPLRLWVEKSVERYFEHLEGEDPTQIYEMVLKEVHTGLLRCVMRYADGNQSKAAQWLGLARGTLRKIMKEHQIEFI